MGKGWIGCLDVVAGETLRPIKLCKMGCRCSKLVWVVLHRMPPEALEGIACQTEPQELCLLQNRRDQQTLWLAGPSCFQSQSLGTLILCLPACDRARRAPSGQSPHQPSPD